MPPVFPPASFSLRPLLRPPAETRRERAMGVGETGLLPHCMHGAYLFRIPEHARHCQARSSDSSSSPRASRGISQLRKRSNADSPAARAAIMSKPRTGCVSIPASCGDSRRATRANSSSGRTGLATAAGWCTEFIRMSPRLASKNSLLGEKNYYPPERSSG